MSTWAGDPLFSQQWYLKNTGQSGGTAGIDLNLAGVLSDYAGQGVVVGVMDQGIEFNHPDLAANVSPALSISTTVSIAGDGQPRLATDNHGMNVSGIIAGVAGNGIGVVGIAPQATLGSVYVALDDSSVEDDSNLGFTWATSHYDVINNSWGGGHTSFYSFTGSNEYNAGTGAGIETAATTGRDGLGTVIVFSAGNDRLTGANTNSQNIDNSPYTIAVAAIDHNGRVASYSTPGASILVGAPSGNLIFANVDTDGDGVPDSNEGGGDPVASGWEGDAGEPAPVYQVGDEGPENPDQASGPDQQGENSNGGSDTPVSDGSADSARTNALKFLRLEGGIVTTDRMGLGKTETGAPGGDYSFDFDGTSAAAPMVTGVAALMLEANPDLGYRDVQDILALTARNTDAKANWTINAADNWNGGGMHVNNDVGYGLVDAHAAVRLAETWTRSSTTANVSQTSAEAIVNANLPDGGPGVTSTVQAGSGTQVERAEVQLDLDHPLASDLTITLASPSGTKSVLLTTTENIDPSEPDSLNCAFPTETYSMTSTQYLGESSAGTWTLTVADDHANGEVGILKDWKLILHGQDSASALPLVYTNEFSYYAAQNPARAAITDASGKTVINASAVTSSQVINANAGSTSVIDNTTVTTAPWVTVADVFSGDGNDILVGNGKTDLLSAGRGNDSLYAGAGSDTLEGGAGTDTAVFGTGLLDNAYNMQNGLATVYTAFGVQSLSNVEYLAFSDGVYALNSLPTFTSVASDTGKNAGVLGAVG